MVTCGYCKHPGVHATIATVFGGIRYCTGCPICQEELRHARQEAKQQEKTDPPRRAE